MNYTVAELTVVAAAREIGVDDVAFYGVGVPIIAGLLAKFTHAPDHTILFEWGQVDPKPRRLPFCVSDSPCNEGAVVLGTQRDNMLDAQNGHNDVAVLGCGQIDKYGNINTTFFGGDYNNQSIRLAGSGGANDLASNIRKTVIMTRGIKRTFVDKVDYLTSPGYLNGPGSREKYGFPGGPVAVITPMGVFRFDRDTREMYLDTIHEGVDLETIKAEVPWDLKIQDPLRVTEPPTGQQLDVIRKLDPQSVWVGGGRDAIMQDGYMGSFYNYLEIMKNSYEPLQEMYRRNELGL